MKIVTAAEMREIDRRTSEEIGIPSFTLMENAGGAVADFCLEQYPAAQRIGVICGKGNNGGDGLVTARKLHEAGKAVRVLLLADPNELQGDAATALKRLAIQPVVAKDEAALNGATAQEVLAADLLVDAILGTGFKPPITGFYRKAIECLWRAGRSIPVISVDLPSGVDADSMRPEQRKGDGDPFLEQAPSSGIVTFTAPKPAHVFQELTSGPIVVAQIGTPFPVLKAVAAQRMEVITRFDCDFASIPRSRTAHKGDFGHVLVVGGSRGKAGAAAMAGMAALRAGAGLCTVAVPRGVQSVVAGFAAELMTEDLAETDAGTISLRALEYGRADELARGKSVIAVGPGISRNAEAAEFVRTVVHRRAVPVVLDADGLNAFAGHDERLDGSGVPLILTPHPGEMARLAGIAVAEVQRDRVGVARKFAKDHNCIVVLKGWRTLVAEPGGEVWVNTTGNPGMATGGTGDVLTGLIAGVIAQSAALPSVSLLQRVLAAVRLHGAAGDLAGDELGEQAMLATDLLRFLPAAFRDTHWHLRSTPIVEGHGRRRFKDAASL